MRTKSKGKVHPSPSPLPPSSFSSSSKGDDCLSVLNLLPAVILVLVSALSPEDKQVLAYLITRSFKTTIRSSCDSKNNKSKAPVFDCECFDCYMSYWLRWDSSPNRELIHQIIEAFEDHLTNGENNSSAAASQKPNGRGGGGGKKKKKDKSSRSSRVEEEPIESLVVPPCDGVKSPEKSTEMLRLPAAAATGYKGLARKVLPDVMGLFNSRFWRLWNPNP
ncbi:hypothetical protein Bca4012_062663 [Brassica carinata]|uniref:Uncharacterized protein n=1 Tax=Brassica carinata TaxID=52824 RepID=A0A8X7U8E8_BRACI|nr:hypothetical protein Bca52824_064197 [Brassica carinata]